MNGLLDGSYASAERLPGAIIMVVIRRLKAWDDYSAIRPL